MLGFVFVFVCLCVFCLFVLFRVVFGALVCFVSFCVLDDRDSIQDYVSVLHQFTFAATLLRRLTHDLINQLIPIATCSHNMLNDLAEAMKVLDGKKRKDTTPQPNQDPQWQQSQPLHGLKLVIKEEVLPMKDQPEFPSLELLATRGLLAPDTWKCKRAQVSLKATIDVPMLGTIIEQKWGWTPRRLPHARRMATAHRRSCQTMLYSSICEPAGTG